LRRRRFFHTHSRVHCLAGSDSIIEVVVGTEATSWHLHKALLINRSPFFKLALDGHFKGSSENKVILAEDESTIFALFVQWLYTSTFNALSSYDLIHAYILGDRLGTTDFKNKAIDQLHAANLWKCTFTPSEANTIFAFTTAGCGLRRLAVDSIALAFLTQVLDVQAEDWKSSFTFVEEMTEVMAAMARQVRGIWKDKPQTEYHDVEQRQAH